MWLRRTKRLHGLLDLELAVTAEARVVRLDHFCVGAGMHRLLGIELTDAERDLLLVGETATVVVACDRCIWERRLVLRRDDAQVVGSSSQGNSGQSEPPTPAEIRAGQK